MKQFLSIFFKGVAMGIANVIPGVSGGTVALVTGIFDRLINAIKSLNKSSFKLLLAGKFKDFAQAIDLRFLIILFGGIFASIISVAKLFEYLFEHYPVYLWALFFGLVLASIFYVAKTITSWNMYTVLFGIIGTAIAVGVSLLNPAQENSSILYLILCGVVAACSMILPGLSGSFVLILMGNYKLIMIDAINDKNVAILVPVVVGAVLGILAFSHILSWVFNRFKNSTIALLSGFILGSLSILWPWKDERYLTDELGQLIEKRGEPVLVGYDWLLPTQLDETLIASAFIALGALLIVWMEKAVSTSPSSK